MTERPPAPSRAPRALIVLAHPDPESFNRAIAERARNVLVDLGFDTIFHDLQAEEFDPLLPTAEIPRDGAVSADVRRHAEELVAADAIVIVHPNWWGMPPAALVGWIDRVFRPDVAYRFQEGDNGEGVPVGLLRAKTAFVFNTSNTEEKRENAVFGDPLELIWKRCVFDLCGVKDVRRFVFRIVVTSSLDERRRWLDQVERDLCERFAPDGIIACRK